MQARLSERERKSLGRKSVNGCWYVPRKKNYCDGRKRIFWPQAEEWAEEYGSSGCIVWYWWCCCCDDENDLPSNEHYLSSSENKAWKKKFRAVRDFNRYRRGHGFKSRTSLKKFRPVREDRFHIHVSQFKYMTYIYSLTFIHHFTDLFRTTMKTWKNLSLRPCLFHYCSSTIRYCEDRFNIHVSQFKYMTFI